jgi:ABC-type branched-subunit amino acid transport system substrate-binding protein
MRLATALAVGLTALFIAACGGGDGGGASAGDGPIKVGGWFPLSGPIAASGIPQKEGATAYFKQLNAEGGLNGRDVDYVARDNAYDPQQTIQAARKLVTEDKVVAIVGANGTATSAAAFPFVMDQSKVPVVNGYGGAGDWFNPTKPLLFGSFTLYEEQGAAAGAWAAEDGHKNILVVRSDPAAFQNVAKYVGPGAKTVDPNVSVSELVVKFQTTDYAPIVGQVRAKKPDAVVLILAFPEAAAYLKAAQLQGVDAPAYGYGPTGDEGLIKLAGKAAEGFHAISLTKPALDPSPAMEKYREALAKYAPKEQPSVNSATNYANAMAFGEVAKKIKGDITSDSIVKAFETAGTIETGILPPLQWSAKDHLGTDEVQRIQVKDGKWVAIGDFTHAPPVTG